VIGVSKESAGIARQARITWLGHSTVLVELDGTRLLTDPVLRDRVAHLRRTGPADAGMLFTLDGVLVSHLHYDHLDYPSLERLSRSVPVVVPRGAGRLLRRRRFEQVVEVELARRFGSETSSCAQPTLTMKEDKGFWERKWQPWVT
jgi:L-ascorbate metabolism protein UlaG (beta-lactamase superfamily)